MSSARLFQPRSGITVSVPLKPPGFQQSFQSCIPAHSSQDHPLSMILLPEGSSAQKSLMSFILLQHSEPTFSVSPSRLFYKQPPPCLSLYITDIPQSVLTIPAKPMPFRPTKTKCIHILGLHTFAHSVFWNSLSSSHFVTQFSPSSKVQLFNEDFLDDIMPFSSPAYGLCQKKVLHYKLFLTRSLSHVLSRSVPIFQKCKNLNVSYLSHFGTNSRTD